MKMCVFWCGFLVSSLLGMPKNAIEQKSKQCWNIYRMCVFLCVLFVTSLLGMPMSAIAQNVQTMLEYLKNNFSVQNNCSDCLKMQFQTNCF
jgi:hypothetical protein